MKVEEALANYGESSRGALIYRVCSYSAVENTT